MWGWWGGGGVDGGFEDGKEGRGGGVEVVCGLCGGGGL